MSRHDDDSASVNHIEGANYLDHMDSEGRIWLVVDPCGLFGSMMVYTLMLAASLGYLQVTELNTSWSIFAWLLLNALLLMAGWAHVKTMITDPGAIPTLPREIPVDAIDRLSPRVRNGEYVTSCQRCNCYRPSRAHHCSTCQRCILNMDHHCPWVNNCVGRYNQRHFIQFTFYICMSSMFMLVLMISYLRTLDDVSSLFNGHLASLLAVFGLLIEGTIFGLFTLIMTFDQLYSIANETSMIDRWQTRAPHDPKPATWKDSLLSLEATFGGPFGWKWFWPGAEARRRHRLYDLV